MLESKISNVEQRSLFRSSSPLPLSDFVRTFVERPPRVFEGKEQDASPGSKDTK